jgi:septum formation protein
LYLSGNPENYLSSVGAYKLEETGIQLFEKIEGDYFAILGLPVLPLLKFLRDREIIQS